ncbi:MAG: hypothetical protein JST48_15110 [Bacteroidetes bacterium]|nr:hypothetical protein [Bacteroidota bacterium]
MKTQSKHHLPEVHIHVNPIYRDVAVIALSGLLVATAMLALMVMFVSRF